MAKLADDNEPEKSARMTTLERDVGTLLEALRRFESGQLAKMSPAQGMPFADAAVRIAENPVGLCMFGAAVLRTLTARASAGNRARHAFTSAIARAIRLDVPVK